MKKEEIMFRIDQLRKDKIIYATEAAATTLVCILAFMSANLFLMGPLADLASILLLLIAAGYSIFMGIGNSLRLNEIRKLEKQLASK